MILSANSRRETGAWPTGNRFQRYILLLRRKRMHPRKKQGAYQIQAVFDDFCSGHS